MQVVTAFIHLVEFGAIVQQPALMEFLPDVLGLFVGQLLPPARKNTTQHLNTIVLLKSNSTS